MSGSIIESVSRCSKCGVAGQALRLQTDGQWWCGACQPFGLCEAVVPAALDRVEDAWALRQAVRDALASCLTCGGKYRPAGGECTHEQTTELWRQVEASYGRVPLPPLPQAQERVAQSGPVCCLVCGVSWYPGHTCIKQPTAREVQDMREQAYWLRVMEDVLDHFGYDTQLAAPASWEAV